MLDTCDSGELHDYYNPTTTIKGPLDDRPCAQRCRVHSPTYGYLKVLGRFEKFDAAIVVGESLELSSLDANIDMSSVNTNNSDRDAHLQDSDFFDAEQHPKMTFRSTSISANDGNDYTIIGDLTINGARKSEALTVTFNGTETFPGDGSIHAGFEARGSINRLDYGVDFNVPLNAGGFIIADRVDIALDIQLAANQTEEG